jgi:hypothetical protein
MPAIIGTTRTAAHPINGARLRRPIARLAAEDQQPGRKRQMTRKVSISDFRPCRTQHNGASLDVGRSAGGTARTLIIAGKAMTEAPELRRARFHLLRAEDALSVAIAGVRAVPLPDSVRVMLTEHASTIQDQLKELLELLNRAQP